MIACHCAILFLSGFGGGSTCRDPDVAGNNIFAAFSCVVANLLLLATSMHTITRISNHNSARKSEISFHDGLYKVYKSSEKEETGPNCLQTLLASASLGNQS